MFNFLASLDAFGTPISLSYKNKQKHTTRFGGCISLIITVIILVQIKQLLDQIVYHEQPQVITQSKIVESPSKNELTPNNFIFVFGLMDSSSVPFIDNSIYTVSGEWRLRQKVTNSQNMNQTSIPLSTIPCKREYFTSEETQSYFLSLNYTNLYCLQIPEEINNSPLFLQGQFDNDIFSFIRLVVNLCDSTQSTCQDITMIKKVLSRSMLQIYYSNYIVELTNFSSPFRQMGQSQFWSVNTDYFQRINIMYQTLYVVDELGFLSQEKTQYQKIKYDSDKVSMINKNLVTDLFDISIYLEKNQELYFMRYYLKIDSALSYIGGLFNLLLIVGSVITKPYSKLSLNHKLMNSTFNFTDPEEKGSRKLNQKNDPNLSQNKSNIQQAFPTSIAQLEKNSNQATQKQIEIVTLNKIQSSSPLQDEDTTPNVRLQSLSKDQQGRISGLKKLHQKSMQSLQYIDQPFTQKQDLSTLKQIEDKDPDIENNTGQKEQQNQKELNGKNKINVTFRQYVKGFLSRTSSCCKSEISSMVVYSQTKLEQFTDIRYIINKLVELDKLKLLLLDENQLQLFNYIQKPLVEAKCIQLQNQFEPQLSGIREEENVNGLYRKTEIENQLHAEKALEKILNRQNDSLRGNNQIRIDKKLVKLIDTQLVSRVMNNVSTTQKMVKISKINETPLEFKTKSSLMQHKREMNKSYLQESNSNISSAEISAEAEENQKYGQLNCSIPFKSLKLNYENEKLKGNQNDSLADLQTIKQQPNNELIFYSLPSKLNETH